MEEINKIIQEFELKKFRLNSNYVGFIFKI